MQSSLPPLSRCSFCCCGPRKSQSPDTERTNERTNEEVADEINPKGEREIFKILYTCIKTLNTCFKKTNTNLRNASFYKRYDIFISFFDFNTFPKTTRTMAVLTEIDARGGRGNGSADEKEEEAKKKKKKEDFDDDDDFDDAKKTTSWKVS